MMLIVVESLAKRGLVVLMSPLEPRTTDPPLLTAVSIGKAASRALLNSARVIVEAPEVNAAGDPSGDASGDPIGDACGLAAGVALAGTDVAILVGIGAAVEVG
jgi:hypothetical protein